MRGNQGKSTKTKVFLILGICLILGLMIRINEEKAHYRPLLQDAVYITDTEKTDASLEGKYVILSGTPVLSAGAYDPDFDITFDGPVVYRTSMVLTDMLSEGQHQTSWEKVFRSEKNVYGSVDYCGEAKIGAYRIRGDVLKYLFETATEDAVTPELAERTGWVYCTNQRYAGRWMLSRPFTYEYDPDSYLDAGMLRISMSVKSSQGIPCTVFGYLRDGCIIATDEAEIRCKRGILDKEAFLSQF